MNDTELAAMFAAEPDRAEPPLPAEYLERTLATARRSARVRRAMGTAAVVVAVALVALVLPWPGRAHQAVPPAQPTHPATLPSEFAAFTAATSNVLDSPPGRAIAYYEYGSSELASTWQWLVTGADRDTYRQVTMPSGEINPSLLSPDGRYLLYFQPSRGTDEFRLLDLTTGTLQVRHTVEWVSNVGGTVLPLAWSPDGRYIAYAVPAPPPADGTAASSLVDGRPIEELAILDVLNDTTVRYPAISPVFAASFAPDGRLAVQVGRELWIGTIRGEQLSRFGLPAGSELVNNVGWSPDGRLLAVIAPPTPRADGSTTSDDARVRFVDPTGVVVPMPVELPYYDVLGWRSDRTILVEAWLPDEERQAIVAVPIDGGSRTVLSRFDDSSRCEYGMQVCNAYRIKLAYGLLPDIGVRPAAPDRGRLAGVLTALPWVFAVLAGGLLAGFGWRRRVAVTAPRR